MKFYIDVRDPQRMKAADFGDPLTFSSRAISRSEFSVFYRMDCHEI